MRISTEYSFRFSSAEKAKLKLPLAVSLNGITFDLSAMDDSEQARATVHGPVENSTLTTRQGHESIVDGTSEIYIEVPELQMHDQFLAQMRYFIAFVADAPIQLSFIRSTLVAESPDDVARLSQLGDRPVYQDFRVIPMGRTFVIRTLSEEQLVALLDNEAGLSLYSSALLAGDPVSEFRELWRLLESAFNAIDDELVLLLAKYPPAMDMEFDEEELRGMLVLRGQASHGKSRKTHAFIKSTFDKVQGKLQRLKCLCEQVLLTKKTWGVATLGVKRLAPITGYIGRNGEIVFIK